MRRETSRCAAAVLTVRLALAATGCLAAAGVMAEDDDRAQAAFMRAPAAAPRAAPFDALAWERRLRSANSLGPAPLRAVDAALLAAARSAHWAAAMALLKSGDANANARDDIGGHALVLAAAAGQDELVRELLKRGAEIDRLGDTGFSALGAAAFAGRRSTVRLLLRAGADVERWGAGGQTALHLASLCGRLDIIDEFIRAKVPVDVLNRQRETALDSAATAGQLDAMGKLIAAGADTRLAGQR